MDRNKQEDTPSTQLQSPRLQLLLGPDPWQLPLLRPQMPRWPSRTPGSRVALHHGDVLSEGSDGALLIRTFSNKSQKENGQRAKGRTGHL